MSIYDSDCISESHLFSPQGKNKPHDGATLHAFILEPDVVMNGEGSSQNGIFRWNKSSPKGNYNTEIYNAKTLTKFPENTMIKRFILQNFFKIAEQNEHEKA